MKRYLDFKFEIGMQFKCINSDSVFKEIGETYWVYNIKEEDVFLTTNKETTTVISKDIFKYFFS